MESKYIVTVRDEDNVIAHVRICNTVEELELARDLYDKDSYFVAVEKVDVAKVEIIDG